MSEWPDERTRRVDSQWVNRVHRPEAGDCHPAVLEARQAEWDAARAKRDRVDALADRAKGEREAEEQARRERATQAEADRLERKRAEREEQLRRSHLQAGGTASTWEAEKATILAKDRERQTLSSEDAGRAAYRRQLANVF